MPHRIGAQQMERMITRPTTADLFELFSEASHLEIELGELRVHDNSPLAGRTLAESGIRNDFDLLVVAIYKNESEPQFNPVPEQIIEAGDLLLLMGQNSNIERIQSAYADR